MFTAHQADARQTALAELEAAGFSLTGESFVAAASSDNHPLVERFLTAGVDINAPGDGGRTALLASALTKNWQIFDFLLDHGADPNVADNRGIVPLMVASLADQTSAMRKLLQAKGARLDAADIMGHRSLHYAVASRSIGAMQSLLDAGASAVDRDDRGEGLVSQACKTRDWRIIDPILTRQPAQLQWTSWTRNILLSAIAARDVPHIKLLLSRHPSPPTSEGGTQPLLACALASGDLEQFRLLLDCGADPNTRLNIPAGKSFLQLVPSPVIRDYVESEPGITALMLAAGLGKTEFMRALIEKGANRAAVSSKNKMPALVFASEAGNAPAMQMLIAGAPSAEQLRIEISLGSQQASVIKGGIPVMTAEVSTGKAGHDTPTGDFVITDKALVHKSTIYKVDMPFFMRLNTRDFGMHQGVLPGYPASHGCIRLSEESAKRLYKEIPIGTLVSIRG